MKLMIWLDRLTTHPKVIRRSLDDATRMVDVEYNIVKSNNISGVNGRTIRCVVENVSGGFTDVEESKQGMYLPEELHEFSYIGCRLLDQETKTPLQYKYDFVVGRPYIIVTISLSKNEFSELYAIRIETRIETRIE